MIDRFKLRPAGRCEGVLMERAFLEFGPLLEVVSGCRPCPGSLEQLPGEVGHRCGHLAHADKADAWAKDRHCCWNEVPKAYKDNEYTSCPCMSLSRHHPDQDKTCPGSRQGHAPTLILWLSLTADCEAVALGPMLS